MRWYAGATQLVCHHLSLMYLTPSLLISGISSPPCVVIYHLIIVLALEVVDTLDTRACVYQGMLSYVLLAHPMAMDVLQRASQQPWWLRREPKYMVTHVYSCHIPRGTSPSRHAGPLAS